MFLDYIGFAIMVILIWTSMFLTNMRVDELNHRMIRVEAIVDFKQEKR
jgi:hypothetical protein